MKSVGKKIIGEIGELGKRVSKETVKAPVDIIKTAVEGGKPIGKSGVIMESGVPKQSELSTGPWANIDREKDQKRKAAIARAALKEFSQKKIERQPSVYERIEQEKERRRQFAAQQLAKQRMAMSADAKGKTVARGSAFSAKTHQKLRKKQTGMETKVNIKAG